MFTLKNLQSQQGKRFLITGGNSGLGYEAARQLSKVGGEVIIACRNEEKAKEAVEKIKKDIKDAKVSYMILDVSDFKNVREFAKEFEHKYERLDVLICNAGAFSFKKIESKDGFEVQWATNYLGHFILQSLMMNLLKKSNDPRIVNQSSITYKKSKIPSKNIKEYILKEDKELGMTTYGDTKFALLLETDYLAREFEKRELNVRIFTAHPGWTNTHLSGSILFKIPATLFAMSPEQGALSMLMCATSPIVKNGHFYGPSAMGGLRGNPHEEKLTVPLNPYMEEELFKATEELTKHDFNF